MHLHLHQHLIAHPSEPSVEQEELTTSLAGEGLSNNRLSIHAGETETFTVSGGSGEYTATSEDTTNLEISVSGNTVTVTLADPVTNPVGNITVSDGEDEIEITVSVAPQDSSDLF